MNRWTAGRKSSMTRTTIRRTSCARRAPPSPTPAAWGSLSAVPATASRSRRTRFAASAPPWPGVRRQRSWRGCTMTPTCSASVLASSPSIRRSASPRSSSAPHFPARRGRYVRGACGARARGVRAIIGGCRARVARAVPRFPGRQGPARPAGPGGCGWPGRARRPRGRVGRLRPGHVLGLRPGYVPGPHGRIDHYLHRRHHSLLAQSRTTRRVRPARPPPGPPAPRGRARSGGPAA